MVSRTRLLFVVLCLAVISLGPTAYATTWTGPDGASWVWDTSGAICTLSIGFGADDFGIDDDNLPSFDIWGPTPAADPIIQQYVRNRTAGYWTDWHVVIQNGYIMEGTTPTVYNESANTPAWDVVVNGNRTGFDAIAVTTMGTQVDIGERLYVYFVFRAAAMGEDGYGLPVKVTQSPTADYPIPEPASLIGLLSGLAAFGFRLRRRL